MKIIRTSTPEPRSAQRGREWNRAPRRTASCAIVARLLRSVLAALFLAIGLVPEGQGASWYTVELIVFERIDDANLDDEVWLGDPGRPPIDESIALGGVSALALAQELGIARAAARYAFRPLDRGQFRLGGVFSRLRASRDYRPLLHIAWHQPGVSRRRAKHAHVQGWRDAQSGAGTSVPGAGTWPAIDGTLQLYRRKFLHLRADLLYYRGDPGNAIVAAPDALPSGSSPAQDTQEESARAVEPNAAPVAGDGAAVTVSPLPGDSSLAAAVDDEANLVRGSDREPGLPAADGPRGGTDRAAPTVFRMTASRRMRPGELHYLDHPLFGLLVIVTRYAPPSG